jgi:hypothetical protein
MKKLTYLLLALIILACSDDSDSSNSNENSINPPAWIQGLWLNDTSSVGFEFRDDNLCSTSTGNTICYKELMTFDPESSVYEEISDTRYYIVISAGFSEYTYEFEKVSETTINWILYPSGLITTLNKQ